jgi:hypothetical protein
LDSGREVSHEKASKWLNSWANVVNQKLRNEGRLVAPGDRPPGLPGCVKRRKPFRAKNAKYAKKTKKFCFAFFATFA